MLKTEEAEGRQFNGCGFTPSVICAWQQWRKGLWTQVIISYFKDNMYVTSATDH